MGYNHGKAECIFRKEWSEKEKLYHSLNMSQEQIDSIYELERQQFNSDRRYYEHCISKENECGVYTENFHSISTETWTEFFDEKVYIELQKFPKIQLKAFYLYKICGYTQDEISSILLKPQRTISYWIGKIAEIIEK